MKIIANFLSMSMMVWKTGWFLIKLPIVLVSLPGWAWLMAISGIGAVAAGFIIVQNEGDPEKIRNVLNSLDNMQQKSVRWSTPLVSMAVSNRCSLCLTSDLCICKETEIFEDTLNNGNPEIENVFKKEEIEKDVSSSPKEEKCE